MNKDNVVDTYFLTGYRESKDKVLNELIDFQKNELLTQLLEGFPEIVVILNDYRQIVAFNKTALSSFQTSNINELAGMRFGEAANCIRSKGENGCGTSEFCKECGAAKAFSKTLNTTENAKEECRIILNVNNVDTSFDFNVYTKPLTVDNKNYVMVSLRDISDEKRKEILEKIFFHDILNTVNATRGLAEVIADFESKEEREELTKSLLHSIDQLSEEIFAQREVFFAEKGNLKVNISKSNISEIIQKAFTLYNAKAKTKNINLVIDVSNFETTILTDSHLVIRSIGNLIKNAIEASKENEEIKTQVLEDEDSVYFNVHNNLVIKKDVQLQLFQRSFSTKEGKGRGVGLYSVKLIIEQYLKGEVSFISEKGKGTIFTIKLPKENQM